MTPRERAFLGWVTTYGIPITVPEPAVDETLTNFPVEVQRRQVLEASAAELAGSRSVGRLADLLTLARQIGQLNSGQVLRAAYVDPISLRYARPETILGVPVVVDPSAPVGRIILTDERYWPRPVEPIDEALGELLTCCAQTFETHAAWWQHRKKQHRSQDTVQAHEVDEDGTEHHVRVSAWRTEP